MLKTFIEGLNQLVFPSNCLICRKHITHGTPTEGVCLDCQSRITFNMPPFCLKCSRHLTHLNSPKCKPCSKQTIDFDFAWAACAYRPPLNGLLHKYKYNNKSMLRNFCIRLMIDFIALHRFDMAQFDLIVPIPLYHSRLRERGFNQSGLLSAELGCRFNISHEPHLLEKTRHTANQMELNEKNRWTNLEGAFRIHKRFSVKHKSILLVDDLLTTGATLSAAARALKDGGAATVGAVVLAIT